MRVLTGKGHWAAHHPIIPDSCLSQNQVGWKRPLRLLGARTDGSYYIRKVRNSVDRGLPKHWCPAPWKDGDEDMRAVLNVAGLDRDKTKNTNSRKEKILINDSPIE